MARRIARSLQAQVRLRAGGLCEYCHAQEQWQYIPFTVDHVIPVAKGGSNGNANLALACFHCNRHKSDAITAIDPETGVTVALFNPRSDAWADHFVWSEDGLRLVGQTPTGRATIWALDMNRARLVEIRAADIAIGRHPPSDDRRQ